MPAEGARRTQAERRSRSEEALLDAAAELISERGVEGASLASIGGRAGVSRGLPTHHFGSKDTLVARLAQRAQERIGAAMVAPLERQARTVRDLSGLDQVFLTVDTYLELFERPTPDQRALLVMWGSSFPALSSVEGMAEAERRSYDGLSDVIASGQADGSIRGDADPTASAVLLHGMMRGIAGLLLTDTGITDRRRVRRTCREWISRSARDTTMTEATTIPATVDDLTPDWIGAVLRADVERVEVLDAHSGTTGRVKLGLTGGPDVPRTLFAKIQPFDPEQRDYVRMIGMGVAEARLYATLGRELQVRIPRVWHASFDDTDGSFVMLLEDLDASGCRFPAAKDPDIVGVAESLMAELPALHAAYWERDLPWLRNRALGDGDDPHQRQRMSRLADIVRSALDQFGADMPPEFQRLGQAFVDHHLEIGALWNAGQKTLLHGDDHVRNLFLDGGRVGFFDWAVACRAPAMRDVSYFICNSLPVETRRAEEKRLIDRYLGGLARHGITLDALGGPRPAPPVRRLLLAGHHHDRRHGLQVAPGRDRPPVDDRHDRGGHRPGRDRPARRADRYMTVGPVAGIGIKGDCRCER